MDRGRSPGDTHGTVSSEQTIYVELLGEGVDVWRPVSAVRLGSDVYRLPEETPDDEHWAFPPGAAVIVETRELSDGPALVVTALAN